MRQALLAYLANNRKPVSFSELKRAFGTKAESTLTRNLKKLLHEKKINRITSGKNTYYEIIHGFNHIYQYFKQPFFQRDSKGYNPDFLKSYIPNQSSFFTLEQREEIHKKTANHTKLQTTDYISNRRGIENMLIDIAFSSSKLEGNTYTYLETEVLIKYNEKAKGKEKEETQMILNHKQVIEYVIQKRSMLDIAKKTFFEMHTLLGQGLLRDEDLGRIRNIPVKIGGSSYTPLDNMYQLLEEADCFFEKLIAIKDPFEQSIFIMTFIPYFQLFLDINKRTSRISANIPLIKHGFAPISLLQISESDYITAILSIYELNDVSLLAELFTNNYLLNMDRYLP